MVYRQLLTNSETPSEGILLRRLLLSHKTKLLRKGLILPDNFIADIESFVERNKIHDKEVCPRCLKGFMIAQSQIHGLSADASRMVKNFLTEEAGHMGYYLDEKEVKPVQI